MAYILRTDEELADGLKRIATEQIERAIAAFSDVQLTRDAAVHQARQRCKKIRALLRLFRSRHSQLANAENARIRDAAAKLAHMRDTVVLLETFEEFRQDATKRVSEHVLHEVYRVLSRRRQRIAEEDLQAKERIESFVADMTAALNRVNSWPLEFEGVSELLMAFAKCYKRGRLAMEDCRQSACHEACHDWRKWSKYQLYQTRILGQFLHGSLNERVGDLKRIGDFLGIDHDLAVLRHELVGAPDFSSLRELTHVGGLLNAIDRRRNQLQKWSLKLGDRAYTKGIKRRSRHWLTMSH